MAFSVNTNVGAAIALQNLNATQAGLETVQSRINTGLAVASAKDDSATYAIAQKLRGDMASMKAVAGSLNRAKSTVDVALSGAESVSDLLNQMKAKAVAAKDAGIDAATRTALNEDFVKLRDQIDTVVKSSTFNGTNLLDQASSGSVSALRSIQSGAGSTLTVANQSMQLGGTVMGTVNNTMQINSAANAATAETAIASAITRLNTSLSTLGSAARQIDSAITFNTKLSDTVEAGIGNLVDADLAKESAKLQSLQIKQQLGLQALSIANQAPSSVMSLFR